MARERKANDFTVSVEGVGTFHFGRRTMKDEIRIQAEFSRMVDGATPTYWLTLVAGWLSTLRILTVQAPEGWNLDELDPLDDQTYAKLKRVNDALDAKEGDFRRKPKQRSEAAGEASGEDGGVLVPPEVPADGE